MTVRVRYFAVLRERRGLSEESVQSVAATPGDLYAELSERHALGLAPSLVKAAVNGRFVPSDHRLRDGDEVVFLPPVAGG